MKILNVSHCGFKNLYNLVMDCFNNQHAVKFPGTNIDKFLNHLNITFVMEEVGIMELIAIGRIFDTYEIYDSSVINFVQPDVPNIYGVVSDLVSMYDVIKNDNDITEDDARNILPIGCIQYKIILNISGLDIVSVSGTRVENFFLEKSIGEFRTIHISDIPEYNAELINTNAARMLLEKIYNFQINEFEKIDVGSDSHRKSLYFDYVVNLNDFKLAHINTSFGELVLFNNTSSGLLEQIMSIKNKSYELGINPIDDLDVFISIRTSLLNYIELIHYIYDPEDFKIYLPIDNEDPIGSQISDKYSMRVATKLMEILKYRRMHTTNEAYTILRFSYLMASKQVKFTIKVKPKDIITIINTSNNKLFVDKFTNLQKQLDTIMNKLST